MSAEDKFSGVKRFELIDENGRAYVTYGVKDIEMSFQDNDTTLKVFLKTDKDATFNDWNDVAYGKDRE